MRRSELPFIRSFMLAPVLLLLVGQPAAHAGQPCEVLEQVSTPNPGATQNALIDIAVANEGTAWAIGTQSSPTTLPLLLYFDGSAWTEHPVPAELTDFHFSSAGRTPDGDVWLAGTRPQKTVFLRIRGGAIDRIDQVPFVGSPIDLSASSSTNVWAITGATDAIRFDGTGWVPVDVPEIYLLHNYGQGIYTSGPDNVWAVGYGGDGRGDYFGYALHWDGVSWTEVTTPFTGQDHSYFRGIDGTGSDDIWIVGNTALGTLDTIALHWNGSHWSQAEATGINMSLRDVVAGAPDDVWASPHSLTPGAPFLHWDGSTWSEVPSPHISGASSVNWRGLTQSGPCDVWTAGSYYTASHNTITARVSNVPSSSVPETPFADRLVRTHPNPSEPTTNVGFVLESTGTVELSVFTIEGRHVRSLFHDVLDAGAHSIPWSGRDDTGLALPSGTYVVQLRTAAGVESQKVTLVR